MRNFKDYDPIIKGLAYKFSLSLKDDFEDLVQEGYVLFLLVEEEEEIYGLSCPFEAALYTRIYQEWVNRATKQSRMKRTGEMIPYHEIEYLLGRSSVHQLDEYLSLSSELRDVVDTIWNCPEEVITQIKTHGFRRGLGNYLRNTKKWRHSDLKVFWNEFGANIVL